MPRAISPGPAGLKFWRAPGLSADNTADINNLPAGIGDQFNPWGPKQPVQDWVQGCSPALIPAAVVPADITNLPAGIADQFNPWGPKQPVKDWTWFNSALYAPAVPVTFPAAAGSYTLTGSAAALALGHVAGAGSYALTGAAVALALRHTAGAGSYALTGSAAALALGHVTGAGSYNATGSAAVLALRHVAGAGSYALTGSAAGFVIPGGLTAGAGSYALTGSAATIGAGAVDYAPGWTEWFNPQATRRGREYWIWSVGYVAAGGAVTLTADSGSYALTGADAALTATGVTVNMPAGMTGGYVPWGRPPREYWIWSVAYQAAAAGTTLTAAAGSYTLTGTAASFPVYSYVFRPPLIFRNWSPSRQVAVSAQNWVGRNQFIGDVRLPADAGAYALTGSTAGSAFGLTANSGSYTLTGFAAVPARTLPAAAGSYALTGSAAGWALRLAANAGSYTLTGSAAAPTTGFPAGAGSYALTGTAAVFIGGGTGVSLAAAVGSYAITGADAVLASAFPFSAASGSYTLTGTAANLATPGFLTAGPGSYALTGSAANLIQAGTIVLPAGAGSYLITGADAELISLPPLEVVPPSPGGVGAGFRVGRYKQFKLKKKRKHDQCEELLEYLRNLPPAEAEAAVAELPPRYLSLLDGLPLPHALVLPPASARIDAIDEDDEDACALLLEMLLS